RRGAPEDWVIGEEPVLATTLSHGADCLQRAAMQLLAAYFRLVGALFLQAREVARCDVARDVAAGEARVVELLDVRVVVQARPHQVVEILVDQTVGAAPPRYFFLGSVR